MAWDMVSSVFDSPKVLQGCFLSVSDTDPVKQEESEGEKRLGVKDRRRGRRERRSTGIVLPGGEVRKGQPSINTNMAENSLLIR